jgi:hypothetical protein
MCETAIDVFAPCLAIPRIASDRIEVTKSLRNNGRIDRGKMPKAFDDTRFLNRRQLGEPHP